MSLFRITAPDIGIDLGTSNVRIYVKGKGLVLSEPTIVIIKDNENREVLAVGEDARILPGRTPKDIVTVRSIRDGVIVDFEIAQIMLHYFIRKAIGSYQLIKPRVVITSPCSISTVEQRAIREALRVIRPRSIHLIEQPIAAALGTGLPVYEPEGSLLVDIGGGTTDVAVISLGGLVVYSSIRVGGVKLDEAIAGAIKRDHNMLVSDRVAEDLKLDLGGAFPVLDEDDRHAMVRGRDLVTSLPLTVEVTAAQISAAIAEPIAAIIAAIKSVLERTPPELASDIMRSGIYLTGSAAQLTDLDRLIASELGIPVSLARDPGDCCALGAGYLAENYELLSGLGQGSDLRK